MEEILKKMDPKNNKQFGILGIIVIAGLAITGIVDIVKC